jgi:hypothetical protein
MSNEVYHTSSWFFATASRVDVIYVDVVVVVFLIFDVKHVNFYYLWLLFRRSKR